jgi:uncharacterized membrane protein YidH (DUF202 family)
MEATTEISEGIGLGDYPAAGRILLAWIRTGSALMGLGFVVACTGLFLQQLQIAQRAVSTPPYGLCCGLEPLSSELAWQ